MIINASHEDMNILYHVPTVRIAHFGGTLVSGFLRQQGGIGCLLQEGLHSISIREKVEDTIGLGTIAVIGAVAGYVATNAMLNR